MMKSAINGSTSMKWFVKFLLGLLVIVLLSVGVIWVWGGTIINREYSAQVRNILPSSRPDVIERGKRLAQVFGCFYGCHGDDMQGEVFFESWYIGQIISPNLTRSMDEFTRPQLEAMIRQGVKPDGKSIMAMPSASFASMTDRDLSAILSFIDSYPDQELDLGRSRYGLFPRLMLIIGEFEPSALMVNNRPWKSDALNDPMKLGEYMAINSCSECHGMDLAGQGEFAPSLEIAKGYTLADFKKLLSTGIGMGDRDLGLMSIVAENRLRRMTEEEMEALHRYLISR